MINILWRKWSNKHVATDINISAYNKIETVMWTDSLPLMLLQQQIMNL